MSRIISYRGLLVDGGQDTINLHTNDGKTGYKVIKFQIIPAIPGANIDAVVKLFKVEPGTPVATIDFSDNTLLAVAWNYNDTYETETIIVFDNETFNQDIYIQHFDDKATGSINYYLELEQVDLTEDQALVAIIKNLRNEQ